MAQENKVYNILVISNKAQIVNKLSMLFESDKYNFELTKDPLVALNKIKMENYDLAIVDSTYPLRIVSLIIKKIDFLDNFTYSILLGDNNNIKDIMNIVKNNDVQGYYNKNDDFQKLVILVSLITNSIYEFTRINMKLGEYGNSSRSPYMSTVGILRNIGEYKDIYTIGHSFRVSEFSKLIGRKIGLSRKDLKLLQVGSLFHDIGKVSIPNNILIKETRLSDNEYYQIKFHPLIGCHILFPIPFYSTITPIIKFHHERYDGKGYPFGLQGKEIPLLTRIVTVADTFDAMTSKRTYRDALPIETVISEFQKNKGTQFDPEITDIFLDIIKNDYYKIKKIQKQYQ